MTKGSRVLIRLGDLEQQMPALVVFGDRSVEECDLDASEELCIKHRAITEGGLSREKIEIN